MRSPYDPQYLDPPDTDPFSVDDVNVAVYGEGWGIFDSYGSQSGPLQIQRIDDAGDDEHQFDDDTDAWEFVWGRAREGSPVHARALEILLFENPMEFRAIEHWCTTGEVLDQPPYDYGKEGWGYDDGRGA